MKTTDFITENQFIGDDAHAMHQDHEVQMARSDCYSSAKYAIELHKLLKNVSEMQGLDGWVSEKLTLANDYLRTVHEYLAHEMSHPEEAMPEMFTAESAEIQFAELLGETAGKQVDMTGKPCTACKKGTYEETDQHDDMDGVLHCTKCRKQVKRHQSANPNKKGMSEGGRLDMSSPEEKAARKAYIKAHGHPPPLTPDSVVAKYNPENDKKVRDYYLRRKGIPQDKLDKMKEDGHQVDMPEAFIPPVMDAHNWDASERQHKEWKNRTQDLSREGYIGKVEFEVDSTAQAKLFAKRINALAKSEGEQVHCRLSGNMMTVHSRTMNDNDLDSFVENAMEDPYSPAVDEGRGDINRLEHRGAEYNVYFNQRKGMYTARGKGQMSGQIQPEWFYTLADAQDHAEMEIGGYDEHDGVAEGSLGSSPDRLDARTGINISHKTPRLGQTNLGNIPGGNQPGSSRDTTAYMNAQRAERSAKLKSAIKGQLGKHHKPNLPEQDVAEGKPQKKADRYHINKDGKPATLASYADRANAVKDRDAKYPDAKVHQVGPRGKVKGEFEEGVAEGEKPEYQKLLKQIKQNAKNDPNRIPRGYELTDHGMLVKKHKTEKSNDGVGGLGEGLAEAAQGHTIEAHGIRGMDRKAWHKTFKNVDQMNAWAEKYDAEIHGTRDLEQAKRGNLSPAMEGVAEGEKKGLYYNVNKRKAAGTSRPASNPKAPMDQAWKDAAKTAKTEGVSESQKLPFLLNDNGNLAGRYSTLDKALAKARQIFRRIDADLQYEKSHPRSQHAGPRVPENLKIYKDVKWNVDGHYPSDSLVVEFGKDRQPIFVKQGVSETTSSAGMATAPGVGKGPATGTLFGGSYAPKTPFTGKKKAKTSVIKR
jgi:hypothetical protein